MLNDLYSNERARIAALFELKNDGDYEHPVFGEGVKDNPLLMLIGEAPGKDEAACGRPFVGRAGKQLDSMLELANIERDRIFVTNAVKFRPIIRKEKSVSNRTPTTKEVMEALPLLKKEIELIRPKVIATLGNVPLSAVAKIAETDKMSIGEVHGMPHGISICGFNCCLFPLYHPAASIYNRELKPTLERDLITLGSFIRSLTIESVSVIDKKPDML